MNANLSDHYRAIADAARAPAGPIPLIDPAPAPEVDAAEEEGAPLCKALSIQIAKAEDDKRLITGIVLQPEITDAQGDIISAEEIEKAAHSYLANFGKKTKLGLQHNSFKKKENRFQLAESYIAPIGFALGTTIIPEGAWIMTMKILDDDIWKKVKDGDITGFSIGGRATATTLEED